MRKKLKWIIGICILLIGVLLLLLYIARNDRLPVIEEDDVKSLTLRGLFDEVYETRELNVKEFIEYYNQISDVVKDKEEGGTTPPSQIIIELKSGTTIYIDNFGDDFNIRIYEPNKKEKLYFGKQHNIRNLLYYGKY